MGVIDDHLFLTYHSCLVILVQNRKIFTSNVGHKIGPSLYSAVQKVNIKAKSKKKKKKQKDTPPKLGF